ncbi:MAG: MoxR family ATPase [Cytophagales bacterium]|nr:MoxR family ATPase [Cytophagales bacterium]
MTTKTLPDNEKPEFFFFKTVSEVNEKGIPCAYPLEGQWIPTDATNMTYEQVDTSLKLQSPHDLRKENPVGTVFGCSSIVVAKGGKDGKGKKFYRVIGDVLPMVSFSDEMGKAYTNFRERGIARASVGSPTTVVVEQRPAPKATSGTFLHTIMANYPCPTIEDDGFYVEPAMWFLMMRNFAKKENTLLVSPSGSGKTELMELISKRTGKQFVNVDMGAKQDPIASLVGTHRMREGKSVFDPAAFVNYIQQGMLINFDEINRAPVHANNILLPLLDGRRELSLDIATSLDTRTVKANEETVFFATANDGAEYIGTNPLDRAIKDRFRMVRFGYPPSEMESKLVTARTKCKAANAKTFVGVANEIRALHESGDLSTSVSVRHTLYAGALNKDGYSVLDSLETAFLANFPQDEVSIVKELITKA